MPRPILIRSEIHSYHVISRCNDKQFFPIPMKEVWGIMLEELKKVHHEHHVAIHSFVLMSNHFHLLCHTPVGNLDKIMHQFLKRTSIRISQRAGKINHLWGGRYKWSLIQSSKHYREVYRYIFQNPLRAGLVTRVEDYPYSTVGGEFPFPLHSFIPISFAGHEGERFWLNQRYESEQIESIKKGLRKSEFKLGKGT